MYRTLFAWVMFGLVAVTAGCSMCDHPYDDCYPLFTGGCDGQPCTGPRAGSIRAMGGPAVPYYEEIPPGQTDSYYDQSGQGPIAPQQQPQMQSRPAVTNSHMPWHRNARQSRQVTADVRRTLPGDAQILSVTDETREEVRARKAKPQLAGQPTPSPVRTAKRATGTTR